MTSLAAVRAAAAAVPDPELPMLSVADLGVLRGVAFDGNRAVVTVTPTYSGCPAMDTIRADIAAAVRAAGCSQVEVRTELAPAWSTDDISPAGLLALAEAGIAPPTHGHSDTSGPVPLTLGLRCPQCGSPDTSELSRFGSTSCKALWRCRSCGEPFDHFRVL